MMAVAESLLYACLEPKRGERALIVGNPHPEIEPACLAFEKVLRNMGVKVELVFQGIKDSLSPMEDHVVEALYQEPDLILSLTYAKMGMDPRAKETPLVTQNRIYQNILQYLIFGKKVSRGFWSPGVRLADLELAARVDWTSLRKEAQYLASILNKSERIHVHSESGSDLSFLTQGRTAFLDHGDFRQPGQGGNMPAGEVFLSPVNHSAQGRLVVDGSMVLNAGSVLLDDPLVLEFEKGFLIQAKGKLANQLLADLSQAVQGEVEAQRAMNCRHLGEFGIGLFPLEELTGRVLLDEKKRGTCHLALGANYDGDAAAPIHFDGVLRQPNVDVFFKDGSTVRLLEQGRPQW